MPTPRRADRESGGKDTWVVSGIGGSHVGRVDMNSNGLPDISVQLEDGRDLADALSQPASSATKILACITSACQGPT